MAEPITPATFGPMVGMRGLTFPPVCSATKFWTTLADIGTAETPAAPIQGLICFHLPYLTLLNACSQYC